MLSFPMRMRVTEDQQSILDQGAEILTVWTQPLLFYLGKFPTVVLWSWQLGLHSDLLMCALVP